MTQMSSMLSATRGNNSLTSMPLWPCFWNLNGDGNAAPVLRSVGRLPEGRGLFAYFSNAGFGSNVSTWDGPPLRKMWMTRLARAGNSGAFGASGLMISPALASVGNKPVCAINDANPNAPMPMPHLHKKSRRVRNASSRRGRWCGMSSSIYHKFSHKKTHFLRVTDPRAQDSGTLKAPSPLGVGGAQRSRGSPIFLTPLQAGIDGA